MPPPGVFWLTKTMPADGCYLKMIGLQRLHHTTEIRLLSGYETGNFLIDIAAQSAALGTPDEVK